MQRHFPSSSGSSPPLSPPPTPSVRSDSSSSSNSSSGTSTASTDIGTGGTGSSSYSSIFSSNEVPATADDHEDSGSGEQDSLLQRIGDQGASVGKLGVVDIIDCDSKDSTRHKTRSRGSEEDRDCCNGDDAVHTVHAREQDSYTRADRRCNMNTTPLDHAVRFPSQLPDANSGGSSDMEKARRRGRFRSSYSLSLLTCVVAAVGLVALFGIVHSYMTRQLDPRGCKTPRMIPTYVRLDGFDTEHTRFSKKYSLYLYRERGVDQYDEDNLGLKGVPVLFLPGNAGSYRQGRSLASEASIYFRDVLQHDQEKLQAGVRGLDFFLADFNEDMAAFHGQTLLDQAEYINDALAYILSLYQDPRRPGRDAHLPDPSSVILIGHSMGGVVARAVLTMSNYQSNTVNTIITMSTPHALPPVSFDADIVATYKQINDYWRESYLQKWANNNPLWHVTLISIAGGSGDSVVPSDYTSLASLVPETHGFTVFTTTMPHVWTGVDHLSIAWCDAFRKSVIQALYEIVDVKRLSQTKQRAERMSVFRKRFLTGLEDNAEVKISQRMPSTLLTLDDDKKPLLKPNERLVIRNFGQEKQFKAHLLPVPEADEPGKKFTLFTDQVLDGPSGHGKAEVLFCTAFPLKKGASVSQLTYTIDLSQGNAAATRLACKGATDDVISLPASTRNSKYSFDDVPPFSYLQYNVEDLSEFQFVAVVERTDRPSPGWLIAEFSNKTDGLIAANVGLGRLLTRGLHVELPASRPLVTEIKIPSLRSSLLAYRLNIVQKSCTEESELFTPMIRQYLSDPYESKYFVNVKSVDVNLHGTAPYMPPHLKGGSPVSGVSFQIWSDPSCATPVKVDLEIDVLGSMGKLTMAYRIIFAAFQILTIALILRKQFQVYDTTGVFISFLESMDLTLRSSLPVFLLALTLLSTSLSSPSYSALVESPTAWLANTTTQASADIDYEKNDMLLGSPDSFFWFLIPLFGAISVGACVVSNYLVVAVTEVLCAVWSIWVNRRGYVKHDEARPDTPTIASTSRSRIINAIILLLFVATVIPYQFAYAIACIVQLATCMQALYHFKETRSNSQYNFYNYTHSILVLMLWVLPINAVVLVVWVRNLAVHWLMPFSSHHNFISVLPYILLVETLRNGMMIPRVTTRLRHVTYFSFFCLAVYSALYGVTYAYQLHHIVNIVIAWLVAIHFSGSGLSLKQLDQTLQNAGLVDGESSGRGKKLP